MGWEALEQWGDDVACIEPLTGGVGVNEVWSVRVKGQLAVGRLGKRSDADLSWETELLRHLDREGLTVPVPIPTTHGGRPRHWTPTWPRTPVRRGSKPPGIHGDADVFDEGRVVRAGPSRHLSTHTRLLAPGGCCV